MSNFTLNFTKTFSFDGDTVTVVMKRLTRESALRLAPYMKTGEDGEMRMSFEDNLKFMDVGAAVLKDCIVSMKGLYVEQNQVDVGTDMFNVVFENMYFLGLLSDMFNELFSESFMDDDDVGKSEEEPADISGASPATTSTA